MFKSIYLIFLLYGLLLFGFFLNVDPNGGAFNDYQNHIRLLTDLKDNFFETLFQFDKYATRHSPVLYILISFFYKLNLSDTLIRFLSIHFCLLLPLIFYKSILIKFKDVDKNHALLLCGLIFLSPTFWSLSIWPDSRIFGLIFFCLSIKYFLKFEIQDKDHFGNSIKCILSYTLASYISPNFSIFSIFYFYFFLKKFNLSKEIIYIVLLNIVLSLPAIFYLLSLDTIFLFNTAVPSGNINNFQIFNFSNKILIIFSIIFFYAIFFLLTKSINLNYWNIKIAILSFIIILILGYFFDYNYNLTGGGIFFKISYFLTENNYLFFIVCFFSIIFILNIMKMEMKNSILIVLLILSNPQYTIYHKYYDPFLLILFTLLFSVNLNIRNFFNYRSLMIFYIYTGSFLIINFLK